VSDISHVSNHISEGVERILGSRPTEAQLELLCKYLNILRDWHKTSRLVGSSQPSWLVNNIVLDSLLFLRVLPHSTQSILDFGSGAGVPGVPLRIMRPSVRMTLLESRRRRASFLKAVVRELPLPGTVVIDDRAEAAALSFGHPVDAVVMRCAGPLDDVLRVAEQFAAPGGLVVASGPPARADHAGWEWLDVPGWTPGTTRTFALHHRPL
jgi:16S rRNA (guanine527-N7)-methyltransferase